MIVKKTELLTILSVLLFCCVGCACENYADVTPTLDAIESVCFQRTNVDENNAYTYFEKNLTDVTQIEAFCAKIDKIKFEKIDPVKFTSADYLIVFEGKKDHKLMVSGDQIIYDGQAYKVKKDGLQDMIAEIYGGIEQQETAAQSKLFK